MSGSASFTGRPDRKSTFIDIRESIRLSIASRDVVVKSFTVVRHWQFQDAFTRPIVLQFGDRKSDFRSDDDPRCPGSMIQLPLAAPQSSRFTRMFLK